MLDKQARANAWLTVSLEEGRNREIRKVMEHMGLEVNRLIRLAYGPFQLGNLDRGQVDEIVQKKIEDLNARDPEQARRIIEGTARSMGIEVVD